MVGVVRKVIWWLVVMVGVVCGKDWPAFEVPSSEVRQGAIGDTRSAGETWQELLLPHAEDFEPIGVPAPRDWLASRQEFGQTFREYLLGRRNGVTPAKSTVYLVPLGDYGESEVAPEMVVLADFVRLYYRVRAVVLPQVGLVDLGVVSRTGRQGQLQLHSAAVLDRLEKRVPENGFALIGVTMEDLYPAPEWNYIFGQARVGKRVGVFSFARYDPRVWGAVLEDDEAKAKRVVLERGLQGIGARGRAPIRDVALHLFPLRDERVEPHWRSGFEAGAPVSGLPAQSGFGDRVESGATVSRARPVLPGEGDGRGCRVVRAAGGAGP